MSNALGPRPTQILLFIVAYRAEHEKHDPSTRHIGDVLGITQPVVRNHIKTLVRQGYITMQAKVGIHTMAVTAKGRALAAELAGQVVAA